MSTTTTVKKPIKGGPVAFNGTPPRNGRMIFGDKSNSRIRKLWWSPKRNEIEIRSDDSRYRNIPAKIGSFENVEYRPGGGNVSIRDERVQWQASSKINSLSNANWSPTPARVTVRTEKLNWEAQPKIGSLEFVDHKPAGGNVAIRDEKLDLSHVTPRVDCGFID